jgi:hypothetical protein
VHTLYNNTRKEVHCHLRQALAGIASTCNAPTPSIAPSHRHHIATLYIRACARKATPCEDNACRAQRKKELFAEQNKTSSD